MSGHPPSPSLVAGLVAAAVLCAAWLFEGRYPGLFVRSFALERGAASGRLRTVLALAGIAAGLGAALVLAGLPAHVALLPGLMALLILLKDWSDAVLWTYFDSRGGARRAVAFLLDAPGVVVHELSHATAALLTGAHDFRAGPMKIVLHTALPVSVLVARRFPFVAIRLERHDGEQYLGYVQYAPRAGMLRLTRKAAVALAPFFGPGLLAMALLATAASSAVAPPPASGAAAQPLHVLSTLSLAAARLDASVASVLGAWLVLSIGSAAASSSVDFKLLGDELGKAPWLAYAPPVLLVACLSALYPAGAARGVTVLLYTGTLIVASTAVLVFLGEVLLLGSYGAAAAAVAALGLLAVARAGVPPAIGVPVAVLGALAVLVAGHRRRLGRGWR